MTLLVLALVAGAIWFAVMVRSEYQRSKAKEDAREGWRETPRVPTRTPARVGVGQAAERAGRTGDVRDVVEEAHLSERAVSATMPPVHEAARWFSAGVTTEVHGYVLPGGLLYVGHGLPKIAGYGVEPALVDPALPVDRTNPHRAGTGLPYWPSYDELSPQARAAYLEWLANGRRTPGTAIGYVFLFLYGLERRTLVDASRAAEAKVDLPAIRQELANLLQVYGANGSFERYARQLLDVVDVALGTEPDLAAAPPRWSAELPLWLRVGLGKIVATEQPIPADWALAWLLQSPEVSLRTPSRRCAVEFRALFEARFAREFGPGLVIKAPRSKLVASVQPASASFGGAITIGLDLPDISRLSAPLGKLQTLAASCEADLEAYSRWLGRNADAPKSLAAVALLPAELVANSESAEVRELRRWLADQLIGTSVAFCDGGELLKRCTSLWGEKLTKTEAILLAQLLQKAGYAVEPDVRFGGSLPAAGEGVAIFQLEPDAPAAPSAGYGAAAILLHLAVAVSAADGTISDDERHQLEEHVERNLGLSDPERRRLSVHLAWLMRSGPRLAGLKKRLEPLSAGQRALIADLVVNVAGADGKIAPEEVKAIEKIFVLLGLPEDAVYPRLHALTTGAAPEMLPRVVEGAATAGFAIPPSRESRSNLALNMDAVAAKIAQSASVAAVLSEIFTDEEVPPPAASTDITSPNGLSPAYTALLKLLIERSAWGREEFEGLAGQHKLLPDAAIEAINDAAFERCGCAVFEGDDPLHLDQTAARELLT